MATVEKLRALLARVRAAKEPDRKLWCEIVVALLYDGPPTDNLPLALGRVLTSYSELLGPAGSGDGTASIDAALALVERALSDRAAQDILADALDRMGREGFRTDRPIIPQIARYVVTEILSTKIAEAEAGHGPE